MVFDHPWFAVPDEEGRFELPPVPAGEQPITAWHERLGDTTVRVRIESGRRPRRISSCRCPNSETTSEARRPDTDDDLRHGGRHPDGRLPGADGRRADRVRAAEIEKLGVAERVFTSLEARRQQEQLAAIAKLAENPTFKAALDTYFTESSFSDLPPEQAAPSAKRSRSRRRSSRRSPAPMCWPSLTPQGVCSQAPASASHGSPGERRAARRTIVYVRARGRSAGGAFRSSGAAALSIATSAHWCSDQPGHRICARTVEARQRRCRHHGDGRVVASTMPGVTRDLVSTTRRARLTARQPQSTKGLRYGEEYAVRPLLASGPARIFTLASIDAATGAATRDALWALGTVALGAFVLAALGSFWLAQTLTDPIDRLAGEIGMMTASRDLRSAASNGNSRELDALTEHSTS